MTKKDDGHTRKPRRLKSRKWRGIYVRDKVYRESKALEKIRDWFLDPFLNACPDGMGLFDWLEKGFFHVDTRWIKRYASHRPFQMPGLLYVAGSKTQYGDIVNRKVKRGTLIYVRHDKTIPDRYDVEVDYGIGRQPEVFRLDELEWLNIKRHLTLIEDEC